MKQILIPAIALLMAAATGCSNKKPPETAGGSSLDISPSPAPLAAYTPAPVPATPVMATPDPIAVQTPAPIGSGSYTVKKGDTLYAIARSHYGDGKQWQRIASANPGVTPQSLRVGQTIVIP